MAKATTDEHMKLVDILATADDASAAAAAVVAAAAVGHVATNTTLFFCHSI